MRDALLPALTVGALILAGPPVAFAASGDDAATGDRRRGRGGFQIEWGAAADEAAKLDEQVYNETDPHPEGGKAPAVGYGDAGQGGSAALTEKKTKKDDFFDDRIEFNSRHQADL